MSSNRAGCSQWNGACGGGTAVERNASISATKPTFHVHPLRHGKLVRCKRRSIGSAGKEIERVASQQYQTLRSRNSVHPPLWGLIVTSLRNTVRHLGKSPASRKAQPVRLCLAAALRGLESNNDARYLDLARGRIALWRERSTATAKRVMPHNL
jgi:hypothetical protein